MKIKIFFLAALSCIIFACKDSNPPVGGGERPVYHAVVSGVVVNESGEPIPGIRYTDDNYHNIEWQGGIYTDEKGVFSFWLTSTTAGIDSLVNIAFVDVDGEENGSYETLYIPTTQVELVWSGKDKSDIAENENELFSPIDLGKFVIENRNIEDLHKRDQNNDTIFTHADVFGIWEICNYVNYSNDSKIDIIDIVSPSNNGKRLVFERINDSEDIFLTLLYANILSTYCNMGDNNSIHIRNEWGGTELFDSTGNEDKLITLLDAVDSWVITNNYLYLIYSESTFNYNALCLKKQ